MPVPGAGIGRGASSTVALTAVVPEPWGKLDREAPDRSRAARLSLVAHCSDVASVLQALLALPTIEARLSALAGRPLTALDRVRLVAIAFLHDVGKAGSGFYAKALPDNVVSDWTRSARAGRDQRGHVDVVAPLLAGGAAFAAHRAALGVDTILAWGGADAAGQGCVLDLWLAAVSHHGEPVTARTLQSKLRERAEWPTWTHPVAGYDPLLGLSRIGAAARNLYAPAFDDPTPMAPVRPAFVHAFAGLVSLADWIGSNADAAYFPYDLAVGDEARARAAQTRAGEVLRAMRLDVEAARLELRARQPSFESVFDRLPRDTQADCARRGLGGTVVLEAETGSGKTESAIWRFQSLFAAGEVDALCFLLPTRVAATSIYDRLRAAIDRLFPDRGTRPSVVLAVPGYLRANGDEAQALPGFRVQWPDGVDDAQRPRYWAAENSKRYFAGAAVAGTIDQFLLSALQTRHAHLRGAIALRALVVVDEVHASDAYMATLLKAALARHVGAGGHALLMSATLPGRARAELLLAGVPHAGPRRAQQLRALSEPEAPYPCIAHQGGIVPTMGSDRRKVVQVELQRGMRAPADVARRAADAVRRGARVLVLRNTVRQAIDTQEALEAELGPDHEGLFRVGSVAALHHGRYAFEDRRMLDRAVEQRFGKGAAESHRACVLVGTQTLEISVDCDADLMITDLAPIDVILQRVGRLHRHAERDVHRPSGYEAPCLVVLTPDDRDLAALLRPGAARGLGIGPRSAYENLLSIEATWRLLEARQGSHLRIPQDNRDLVEAGCDAQALERLAQELGEPWPDHAMRLFGKTRSQAAIALPHLLDWTRPWNDSGWSELDDEARTRLGLDSIDIELAQPWVSPLGQRITTLSVPEWMLPASARDPAAATIQHDEGDELRLHRTGVEIRYGRLGLRAHASSK